MQLWHLTADTARIPSRVSPGNRVTIVIGTWPIEPGQEVWVEYGIDRSGAESRQGRVPASWRHNLGPNSYWEAELGPFGRSERVTYTIHRRSAAGDVDGSTSSFTVGPKLSLALLWHQHQPSYRDASRAPEASQYLYPWVRLHAIRDYYAMAALVAEHPAVHLTIDLTPTLLRQIEDYAEHGATDRALDLTLKPAETLTAAEREEILATFFDADWHHQISPYPRYRELFDRRRDNGRFSPRDLRDLQMWFNLAWFGKEFRDGEVILATGETASVRRFVEQGSHFKDADVAEMVAEQTKIMRAVIPLHRQLQERGQIEVATTPFAHPILPLLIDTNQATVDRQGATYPPRFAHPEDAAAQVRLAVETYEHFFGRRPRGMWPAEGAVGQSSIPYYARHGLRWIATDQGVLARSGQWGYHAEDPDVLCQPYRAEEGDAAVAVFFRDTVLSDDIGFRFQGCGDFSAVAREFLDEVKQRFAERVARGDRVLTIVLDGENAWGSYCDDARQFFHALYGLLDHDPEIQTVSFVEYLDGNAEREIAPHPLSELTRVYDLFTGSWIDETGSAPGVDLGTWIGEPEENRAWELLGQTRDVLTQSGATPESAAAAFEAMYLAEGSDWFWWLGDDQDSGHDASFDELFRLHLASVYHFLGQEPPSELGGHLVPHGLLTGVTG